MKETHQENGGGSVAGISQNSNKKGDKSHRYSAGRNGKGTGSSKGKESNDVKEKSPAKAEKENDTPTSEDIALDQKQAEENEKDMEVDPEEASKEKEEELQRQLENEKKQAEEARLQSVARIELRQELFKKNLSASAGHRPDESFFKKLDSSMKKNTSFVKKLRALTEQQRHSLQSEFNGLNLTKYIQEVATAVVEAKLKVSDVSCAAFMCSLIHQRYADFTALLKSMLWKSFDNVSCKEEDKAGNVGKFRSCLRLIGELVLDGVFSDTDEGMKFMCGIISTIVNTDKANHTYTPVILSLVRHCGEDLAGLMPRQQRIWKEKFNVEFAKYKVVPESYQDSLRDMFKEYYSGLAKHLVREHKDLQNREKQNRQTIGLKGELPPERRDAFEKAQKSYEKLLASTTTLADMLDEEVPDLPEDYQEEREDMMTINIYTPGRAGEYDAENGLWEDEDTRTFYENIKDLKALVPQILFKEKDVKPTPKNKETNKKKQRKLRVDVNLDDDLTDTLSDDEMDEDSDNDILAEDEEEENHNNNSGVNMAALVESYLQKLTTCVNRDFIDEAAEEFLLKMNTKGNRKKLVRALFTVNRTRLDLLPFYARLVATVNPCLPDIGQDLVYLLKRDFRFHVRKKDQINLESKIKTVRFIGELTKFRVCPKAEALHCLKLLLENFTHHNIDMACHLLETCGRFLYRSPESNPRTSNLLDQMMRKKTIHALDSRQTTMIENAFYHCNPPDRPKVQRKVRPPMHEYIRKLLFKDLTKTTTEKVLRQMRKLPWEDPEVKKYAVKCLLHIWSVKYNNVHCAANMLSGLSEYYEDIGVQVVDGLLESIRLGMETNFPRYNQRRISCVKYLGELYNYQLVESDVVFHILYSFLTFGKGVDGLETDLDPPDNLFRIRLICVLLDTCAQYFDRGSSKKKLDCFLTYFQAYIWTKKQSDYWNDSFPFPKEVDYHVSDTIESLRPRLTLFSSAEEAFDAVDKLEKEYQLKFENALKAAESGAESEAGTPVDPLTVPLPCSNVPGSSWEGSQFSASPSVQSLSSADDDTDLDAATEEDAEMEEEGEMVEGEEADPMFNLDPEEEENVRLKEGPKLIHCDEDDSFRNAYEKMLVDTFQQRLSEAMKTPVVDIAIPMHLKGNAKKQVQNENKPDDVNFVLLLKRGNKQQFKGLNVPADSGLAANIRDKQLAEQAEQEEMKRLVLDINKRQEEEAYNEMLLSTQQWRFNHQSSRGGSRHRGHQRLRSREHEQQFHSSSSRYIRR